MPGKWKSNQAERQRRVNPSATGSPGRRPEIALLKRTIRPIKSKVLAMNRENRHDSQPSVAETSTRPKRTRRNALRSREADERISTLETSNGRRLKSSTLVRSLAFASQQLPGMTSPVRRHFIYLQSAFKEMLQKFWPTRVHNSEISLEMSSVPSLAQKCAFTIGSQLECWDAEINTPESQNDTESPLFDIMEVYQWVPAHYRRFVLVQHLTTLCCIHINNFAILRELTEMSLQYGAHEQAFCFVRAMLRKSGEACWKLTVSQFIFLYQLSDMLHKHGTFLHQFLIHHGKIMISRADFATFFYTMSDHAFAFEVSRVLMIAENQDALLHWIPVFIKHLLTNNEDFAGSIQHINQVLEENSNLLPAHQAILQLIRTFCQFKFIRNFTEHSIHDQISLPELELWIPLLPNIILALGNLDRVLEFTLMLLQLDCLLGVVSTCKIAVSDFDTFLAKMHPKDRPVCVVDDFEDLLDTLDQDVMDHHFEPCLMSGMLHSEKINDNESESDSSLSDSRDEYDAVTSEMVFSGVPSPSRYHEVGLHREWLRSEQLMRPLVDSYSDRNYSDAGFFKTPKPPRMKPHDIPGTGTFSAGPSLPPSSDLFQTPRHQFTTNYQSIRRNLSLEAEPNLRSSPKSGFGLF